MDGNFDKVEVKRLYVDEFLRARLPGGAFEVAGVNEATMDSFIADPPAHRLGSPGGGGKWSGDILTQNPDGSTRREEIVLLQFKQDERIRDLPHTDPRAFTGVVTLHLRDGAQSQGCDVKVLEIAHDYLWTPWYQCGHVPTGDRAPGPVSPQLGAAMPASSGRIYHEGGRFVTIYQNDGALVRYDMRGTADETRWIPVMTYQGTAVEPA